MLCFHMWINLKLLSSGRQFTSKYSLEIARNSLKSIVHTVNLLTQRYVVPTWLQGTQNLQAWSNKLACFEFRTKMYLLFIWLILKMYFLWQISRVLLSFSLILLGSVIQLSKWNYTVNIFWNVWNAWSLVI